MPDNDPQHQRRRALRLLGRRIADLRTAKGWNQHEFAKRIERAINSVGRWERGTHEMGILDALAIARELGISLAHLLDEASPAIADLAPRPPLRLDLLDEGLDLLDRSRRLLQKEGLDLLDESRRLLERLRAERAGSR